MLEVADRSETYLSFTSEMEGHMDMVSHLDLSAVHDMMAETWGEVKRPQVKKPTGTWRSMMVIEAGDGSWQKRLDAGQCRSAAINWSLTLC